MRVGFWSLIINAALLWGGGQGLYTVLRNRTPTQVSCSTLRNQKPAAEWLALKGCVLDLGNSGHTTGASTAEVFIAVEAPDATPDTPVRIVLASEQPATIAWASKPPTSFAAIRTTRDIEGLALFGIELKDSRKKAIAKVIENLDPDFIVLAEGEHPNPILAIGMFTAGLLMLAFNLRRLLRRPPA